MKFIDEATIEVTSGNGGNGCAGFRREKYVPKGGPDGGDGGRGGSIILKADHRLTTLMDVRYHHHFKATSGGHGKGSQKTGKCGEDKIIRVPVGTVIYDFHTKDILADLSEQGEEWIAAKGGRGGLGNIHFVSSTHQAPREKTPGEKGEHKKLKLELKLLADVGLVGFPNAGKSTLISAVSNARPKIADYPFTTKVPHLGLVQIDSEKSFVMADIPGLIEGAHEGAGMGTQFLKHVERTKVLVHLIDVADHVHIDPVKSYKALRKELSSYNKSLAKRPEIVVITKMDLPHVSEMADEYAALITKACRKKVLKISAATKEGLDELKYKIAKLLFSS